MPSEIAVDVAAVSHLHHHNHQELVSYLVYDPVFSCPQSEKVSLSTESNRAGWPRIIRQSSNPFVHSFPVLGWKGCDLTPGCGENFETVFQSRPNSFRACS